MDGKTNPSEVWATDVFFSTGEKSGDILVADVYKELRRAYSLKPRAASLGGSHSVGAGIRNLLDRPDLYLVGLVRKKLPEWEKIFFIIKEELRLYPPKVLVGVTHHTFNLPLVTEIGGMTAKILVSPPEVWAWQATPIAKAICCLFHSFHNIRWLKHAPLGTTRRSLCTYMRLLYIVAFRGKLALQHYDTLVFLNPISLDVYDRLRKRYRSKAKFVFVGHPASTYSRAAFEEEAHTLRKYRGVPEDAHLLTIFPGSRETSIEQVLPITLEVAAKMLKKHAHLRCLVSVADRRFAPYIDRQVCLWRRQIDDPYRLSTSDVDSRVLLCASSHAILSSGTVTLEAACLGVPGTVVYDLPRETKRFGRLFVRRQKIGREKKCCVPFALPNAILAWMDFPTEKRPYQEFVLSRKSFEPGRISASVDEHLRRLPPAYCRDKPPLIHEKIIEIVRKAFSSPSESKTPQGLIAEEIAKYLGRPTKTKSMR